MEKGLGVFMRRSHAYIRMGELEKADCDVTNAIAVLSLISNCYPDKAIDRSQCHFLSGCIKLKRDLFHEAIVELTLAISINDDDRRFWLRRGQVIIIEEEEEKKKKKKKKKKNYNLKTKKIA